MHVLPTQKAFLSSPLFPFSCTLIESLLGQLLRLLYWIYRCAADGVLEHGRGDNYFS
jgi:hypothetical protein